MVDVEAVFVDHKLAQAYFLLLETILEPHLTAFLQRPPECVRLPPEACRDVGCERD
jgi:hypothetical protein